MSNNTNKIGSIWRRWDLHLHAPGTKLSNGFGAATDSILGRYVKCLQDSTVDFFGITDYFSFDSYIAVANAYKKRFPTGRKVFIPNIEFRLTESVSQEVRHVNIHVLVDPTPENQTRFPKLLSDLNTSIIRENRAVRCNELLPGDYKQATVTIADLCEALTTVFPDRTSYMIVTAANNDGLRGLDTGSARSKNTYRSIEEASDAFFGSSKNTEHFQSENRYGDGTKAKPKPVFSGSDAHTFDHLDRLSGDDAGFEATWIKADLTFHGLRQTLFEPKARVHLGERPLVLGRQEQDATRFITKLQIRQMPKYSGENGSWFDNIDIPFNPELTAIIGNKGSGKSAIADIIGLLGESRKFEHFSFLTDQVENRKFRQKGYAENFTGKLSWGSGAKSRKQLDKLIDTQKPETVKYLPQNYFESLTNEIEVTAFRREIEEVVFSHVEESDRMGTFSFSDLEALKTAQSRRDISISNSRLRELNRDIITLEDQASPVTLATAKEQLKQKQNEYKSLRDFKPTTVHHPQGETEIQKKISDRIDKIRKVQADIEKRGIAAVAQLSSLKRDVISLARIKESVLGIDSNIKETMDELRMRCAKFDLAIEDIVKHQIDTRTIDKIIEESSLKIKELEHDRDEPITTDTEPSSSRSVPELRRAYQYHSQEIKELQETLSAPLRRYQRYVQQSADINEKMLRVLGDETNPEPGTIKYIENYIDYLENDLKRELSSKIDRRNEIARSIFNAKEQVREFYDGLRLSVEKELRKVGSDEFNVTIDVSFVLSHEFPKQFFDLIHQGSRGQFRGSTQGAIELERELGNVNLNDVETILAFAKRIVQSVGTDLGHRQVRDIKQLYDLLYSLEYFEAHYELRLDGKNLNQLSPGEKGLLLLVFHLHLDREKTPLIIDQPEDNLDNDSIFKVLANCIRQAKETRQVILVTHNPNLAVGADAEQILYVSLDKAAGNKFSYDSGSIEDTKINELIVKILEGSKPAFIQRRLKYQSIDFRKYP